MGIEDRDWYQDEQLRRLKKASNSKSWFVILLFWMVVFFLLFQFLKHHEELSINLPFSFRSRQASQISEQTVPQPPEILHYQQIVQQPVQVQRSERVVIQPDREPAAERGSQGSVTIYLCKAYSGGTFWSSAHCNTQQALIDRMATVPSEMPFDQQVQIAEGQRASAAALYNQQPSPEVQRSNRCGALKHERETIEKRYSNWQWQPLEVINPDQTRMKGLRAEQARLGCPTQ